VIEIVVLLICIAGIIIAYNYYKPTGITSIPFKESIDLINLPIVTFVNNNVKLHFLLDTGSDDSYINVDVLDKLVVKKSYNVKRDIVTGNGSISSSQIVLMDISYKEQCFENAFVVSDMGEAFDAATGASGIKIHGILGSVFFAKYKYVLYYMKLEAYSKV
jgi:hypothetical protein